MAPGRVLAAAGVLALAAAAQLAPAWTYAVSLAVFGLPHLACELRYVDQRFSPRLARTTWERLAAILVGIACVRAAGLAGLGSLADRTTLELLLGAALVAVVVRALGRGTATVAAGATLVIALAGAALWPVDTLVVFAFLHNLTPVGLLAERLQGRARAHAMTWCVACFLLLPFAIAMGWFGDALGALGTGGTVYGPEGVGGVDENAAAFVPPSLLGNVAAANLFRAAAFLQCMHYVVTIGVLPHLGPAGQAGSGRLPWPRWPVFATGTAVATLVVVMGHLVDFAATRACYGILASVHAWVEVPVLLLACPGAAAVGSRLAVETA